MAPFLYASSTEGYTTAHSLHLNTMSRSGSTMIGYDEQESFRKEPYTPPIRYHQHQGGQSTQKNHEVYMEHMSFSTQDTLYNMYNQDLRSTRSRHQQQIRPPSLPSSFQYQQSPKHIKTRIEDQQNQPERPIGYTSVNGGSSIGPDTKTSIHAVLDYDNDFDDYYDDEDHDIPINTHVTPIQGPIFLKNNTVPVIPLYSYPQLNNGTFVQIPILWTALSIVLGAELRGDLIRGAPCIKRYHQLFCPTAGNTYPIDRIERFIDENKALMKRMYGDFEMNPESNERGPHTKTRRKSREVRKHDILDGKSRDDSHIESEIDKEYFSKNRNARQSFGKNRSTGR